MKKKMSPSVLFTAFALSVFLSMSLKNLQAQSFKHQGTIAEEDSRSMKALI